MQYFTIHPYNVFMKVSSVAWASYFYPTKQMMLSWTSLSRLTWEDGSVESDRADHQGDDDQVIAASIWDTDH